MSSSLCLLDKDSNLLQLDLGHRDKKVSQKFILSSEMYVYLRKSLNLIRAILGLHRLKTALFSTQTTDLARSIVDVGVGLEGVEDYRLKWSSLDVLL